MKIGRNDPCPCGSGKKYKKCCLKKEMEQKAEELEDRRAEKEAEEEFWEGFDRASHGEKIDIFREQLDSEGLSPEEVFDLFARIEWEALKKGDFGTTPELVDLIKEKQPEIYEADQAYYHRSLIENMALAGDFSPLPLALEPFAEDPDAIDAFHRIIELLMYHNQTDALVDVMERAYPKVMASEGVVPQGKGEFGTLMGWFIIFSKMEEQDTEDLYPAVSKYWDISKEEFEAEVAPLAPGFARTWQRADFAAGDSWEGVGGSLLSLTAELMAELHREGMSYSRALLARNTLMEYIFEEYHHPEGTAKAGSLLTPVRRSLDRHLAGLMEPLNSLPHGPAALMEALPSYLRFLHVKGLIERSEMEEALAALKHLKDDVVRFFEHLPEGRWIVPSIERGWEDGR